MSRRNLYGAFCHSCGDAVPPQGGWLAGKHPVKGWQVACESCHVAPYSYFRNPQEAEEHARLIRECWRIFDRMQAQHPAPYVPPCLALLGLCPPVSADDIKRAYREKALTAHPDHGGDASAFVALKRARDEAMCLVAGGAA